MRNLGMFGATCLGVVCDDATEVSEEAAARDSLSGEIRDENDAQDQAGRQTPLKIHGIHKSSSRFG